MSKPLPLSERLQLIAELDARTGCPTPAPGSNVVYLHPAENARLIADAARLGLLSPAT
jgi:hypothetical protein